MHPSCTLSHLCSFSDFFPLFLVLQCPSPPNIHGGNHDSQDVEVFLPGMAVNYSCDPGYSLMGEASIYCTESGNWSLPTPQCEGSCGAPPRLSYAELAKEHQNMTAFPVGSTVRYACRPGFMRHPIALPALTCLKNHTWSDVRAFCKSEYCENPPNILHGGHSGLGKAVFTPGTSVNYSCETGFSLVGMASIYCTESGAWSHPSPVCQGVFLLQGAKKKVQYIMLGWELLYAARQKDMSTVEEILEGSFNSCMFCISAFVAMN
uniref:Sushi domain-containing protein n=1 Tax=Pavo cristatus TaxID=9049 RepID=A0A8C9L882_PAVCR